MPPFLCGPPAIGADFFAAANCTKLSIRLGEEFLAAQKVPARVFLIK
jgi:hypothetical protein